jgi:hypothetical protein
MDDTSKSKMENLTPCHYFHFVFKCQLFWSKNVHGERDAPNQIFVGARDPQYCVLQGNSPQLFIESGEGALTPLVLGIGKSGDNADIRKIAKKMNINLHAMLQKEHLEQNRVCLFCRQWSSWEPQLVCKSWP